mmetsp:Transcript_11645/g.21180  ORF Transcript_11645/g.21180 Transcript_11645/m.21180 type:complete len:208 (-) Transcript_11645:343-966(-)
MINGLTSEIVGTPSTGLAPFFQFFQIINTTGHGRGLSCGLKIIKVGTRFNRRRRTVLLLFGGPFQDPCGRHAPTGCIDCLTIRLLHHAIVHTHIASTGQTQCQHTGSSRTPPIRYGSHLRSHRLVIIVILFIAPIHFPRSLPPIRMIITTSIICRSGPGLLATRGSLLNVWHVRVVVVVVVAFRFGELLFHFQLELFGAIGQNGTEF